MRRRDREITDREKMLEIVAECDCCRLGLVDNGEAYIVPMNFGFEDAGSALTLYFHCAAEGRKLDLIGSGADVSFEMDCSHLLRAADIACAFSYSYGCVMGRGHAAPATDNDEKHHALERLTIIRLTVSDWSCKASC